MRVNGEPAPIQPARPQIISACGPAFSLLQGSIAPGRRLGCTSPGRAESPRRLKPNAANFSAFWQHAFRGAGRQTGHAASRGGILSVGKPGKFNGIACKSA